MTVTSQFLRSRRSVRNYDGQPLTASDAAAVQAILDRAAKDQPGLSFRLFTGNGKPFSGFRRSYGFFQGVANYVAVIIDPNEADVYERAGFSSQQAVMEMTAMGLGTCYVAATYDAATVDLPLDPGQRLLMLITLGYAADKRTKGIAGLILRLAHRHERTAMEFFSADRNGDLPLGDAQRIFPTLTDGLEGLVSAPSQMNRQPVRVHVTGGDRPALRAYVDDPTPKNLVDLGIGKYNFAAAAGGVWQWGNDAKLEMRN